MRAGAESCVRPGPQILFLSARFQKAGRISNRETNNHESFKGNRVSLDQGRNNIMKLNFHIIVAIGCLVSPLASLAQSPVPPFSDDNWISLGGIPGANNNVHASVVDAAGNLYIGGDLTTAGETTANYIAKWDGSSWSVLGSGMNGRVSALAMSGSDLYAGGSFTTAGGLAANGIAKWNGSSWSALGSGMNGSVSALAVSGTDLYAGGSFTTAGGKAAGYAARAILRLPSLTLRQTTSSTVTASWPSPSTGFVLQQNTSGLGSVNWSNVTGSILDDGTNNVITQPIGTSRFFRLVLH